MATFHFELASPEQLVFAGEVEHVVVPGSEGEFGVLAHHAPLIALLRPGILKILGPNEQQFVVVRRCAFAEPQQIVFKKPASEGLSLAVSLQPNNDLFNRAIKLEWLSFGVIQGHWRTEIDTNIQGLTQIGRAHV